MAIGHSELLQVSGKTIEYFRFGQGSPVIFIMGYGATMQGWDKRFLHELSKSHEVVLYNNRNVGRSVYEIRSYFMADLAEDIESLRVGLQLGQTGVVGVSMGGMIAQTYAALYPNHISHLVLINTAPSGSLISAPSIAAEKIYRGLVRGRLYDFLGILRLGLPSVWSIMQVFRYHIKVRGSRLIMPRETIIKQQTVLEAWSAEADPVARLKAVKAPTLILCGLADRIIPSGNSRILSEHIANSKLMEFEKGEHLMLYQYPILLANAIKEFMVRTNKKALN